MRRSPNLALIVVHKSLDTIKSSYITIDFLSDNLFLKVALNLSFKLSAFVPELILRPQCMVVLPVFTADMP